VSMQQKHNLEGEQIAIRALGYLASDDERLQRFLDLTGLTHDTVRSAALTPGFFAAVLDYFLAHEPSLVEFANWAQLEPEHIVNARSRLEPQGAGKTDFFD
jgi:hypothetical protein